MFNWHFFCSDFVQHFDFIFFIVLTQVTCIIITRFVFNSKPKRGSKSIQSRKKRSSKSFVFVAKAAKLIFDDQSRISAWCKATWDVRETYKRFRESKEPIECSGPLAIFIFISPLVHGYWWGTIFIAGFYTSGYLRNFLKKQSTKKVIENKNLFWIVEI